jgi:hypothetical protein
MDLFFLKPLYERPGPFASVYLDMRRTEEEAPRAIEVRRHVRHKELADQGAPPETIEAVERVVREEKEQRESGCLAVFASGGEVGYTELLDGPPRAELARFAPLPHVTPLLAQRGEPISHLLAVANRLGAQITCMALDGTRWTVDVPPEKDFPVHKPKSGDMLSQPHYQQAAEDVWRANAKKIAQAIDQIADSCGSQVVVVAGDVRARTAVLEQLSDPVLARTVEAERAGGPSLHAEVARAVERKRTERMMAVVDRFNEQLTKRRRAVDGLSAVVGALRKAQVASLLIEDRADPHTPVWTGPQPTDLATSAAELRDLGVARPLPDRADAALIRALVGTDGELMLISPDGWHCDHGVGALLRYADTYNAPEPARP